MESNKKYWKGLEEYHNTPLFVESNKDEFAEPLPIEEVLSGAGLNSVTPRRNFLKALGFGLGAVTLAACNKMPVHKSIPYLIKPEEIVPGVPNYYNSSFEGVGVMVKTIEGRPIKVEGNPNCILSKGALEATAQASVLELYDTAKYKNPLIDQKEEEDWSKFDAKVKAALQQAQASGKKIYLVSQTKNSPSTKAAIAEFIAKYPAAVHVSYDPISYSGMIKANEQSFGKANLPHYRFDKADVIVSFGADFLGTWVSPLEFTRQYTSNRDYKALQNKKMSRHIQFETGLSLTGTNADSRIAIKPSEEGQALLNLYAAITGQTLAGTKALENKAAQTAITLAAKELVNAKGRALVVCGSNDIAKQTVVNAINSALLSYGATINLDNASNQYTGNDAALVSFVGDMKAGNVSAAIFFDANPQYHYFNAKDVSEGLKKVATKISFANKEDETSAQCNFVAPANSYLESWGDSNPVAGSYLIVQPTINPINNTRIAEESLLTWADAPVKDYYQYVKANWEASVLKQAGKSWGDVLQTGAIHLNADALGSSYTFSKDLNAVAQAIVAQASKLNTSGDALQLHMYQSSSIGDGTHANNPWLLELPDAVSKVTWENYAALNPKQAEKLGLKEFDVVEIKVADQSIKVPVLMQPGQAMGTVSVALGWGRTHAGKAGNNCGANAFPFLSYANETIQYHTVASVKATGDNSVLAMTQTHHSFEGRNIIRETTFKKYLQNPKSGSGNDAKEHEGNFDLFPEHKMLGQNWMMAIDLNACTGCGACVVACHAENNVPVVGKAEVRRRRDMHWLRIDRYYSFDDKGKSVTEEKEIEHLEDFENISVVHQPMMCQHCDHAPCETVCPVLATVHSSDGLNHMAYNRCVGTRYCANNCPYKVRRFNWFNYWNDSRFENYLNNEFTQLVLNPDVTPRFRGVMEKCSMCIQRIQAGKLQAKIDKRELKDGDIKMACQQTCAANAIIFGDANDPNSELSKALQNDRVYYVLEELGVKPGVGYMTKVRNINETV